MSDRQLPDWIQNHLDTYLRSGGKEGHIWNGVPCLLLTTAGKDSGKPRQLPLIYGEDNGKYIVVASKGGAPDHPAWYKNLVADNNVEVQVGTEKFAAKARTAEDEERARLWSLMAEIWPSYNDYQESTEREIPLVVLERA